MANSKKHTAYIGLGANLNHPINQLQLALDTIAGLENVALSKSSSFYQTKPMGPQDQNDYVNAVAKITTSLAPLELLDSLQQIELEQGRVRKEIRWGPRTLDLDILLFNNETINSSRLIVPHYGMKQRNFVLVPLFEIAADLILPDGSVLATLVKNIESQGIIKL